MEDMVEVHKAPFQAVLAYPNPKAEDGHEDVLFTNITPKVFFKISKLLLKDSRRRHGRS